MNIDVKVNAFGNNLKIEYCSHCLGVGKLKVMQSVATDIGSFRGKDKEIRCKHCDGTGIKNTEVLLEGMEEGLLEGLQSAT
ncbi:hypothetical protein [Clostridium sp.]|uniref:hypothetical protein n=1 Tax=Clostridium sp. TaxID=1506 RepID=UPI002906F6AF|nr:hypothetical protein [Clostridium sp.]MDU3410129.1 hypothetical protein [Clostridium sp.]